MEEAPAFGALEKPKVFLHSVQTRYLLTVAHRSA